MSDRVTVKILHNMLVNLNRKAKTTSDTAYILESSYGKQQVYQRIGGSTGLHRVSPLLSKSALYQWLWAFMDGMDAGYQVCQRGDK